jgi:peptidyl-dipeptidase Dcp
VIKFEETALKKAGVAFEPVPPRYRTTYFSHIFASGYSAGYYSYIWSEILDADTVEWFKENGGLKRENGDRFRTMLLSRGGSVEAMDLFRAFRGRDPEIKPLLKRRGLDSR